MWEVNDNAIYSFRHFDGETCTRYCDPSQGNNNPIKVSKNRFISLQGEAKQNGRLITTM